LLSREEFLAGRHHFMVNPALPLDSVTEVSLEDFLFPDSPKKNIGFYLKIKSNIISKMVYTFYNDKNHKNTIYLKSWQIIAGS